MESGNVKQGFELSDHILKGEVHIGGQEHFYLETQSFLAVPKNEDREMEMFVATQNPTEMQVPIIRQEIKLQHEASKKIKYQMLLNDRSYFSVMCLIDFSLN